MTTHVTPPQRRKFLFTMLGGIGAAFTALAVWPIWRYLLPWEKTGEDAKIPIAKADIQLGKAHFFSFRGQPAVVLSWCQLRVCLKKSYAYLFTLQSMIDRR